MKTGIRKITYMDSAIIESQTDEICEPTEIVATGFIVKETNDYLTIARELVGKEYRGQLSIPKVAIIRKKK